MKAVLKVKNKALKQEKVETKEEPKGKESKMDKALDKMKIPKKKAK